MRCCRTALCIACFFRLAETRSSTREQNSKAAEPRPGGRRCANFQYVLQLGIGKSGTSSTVAWLDRLGGYVNCEHALPKTFVWPLMRRARAEGLPVLHYVVQSCSLLGEIMAVTGDENAIAPQLSELPQLMAYMRPLRTLFVLNVREEHDWLRSVDCWPTPFAPLRSRFTTSCFSGLPCGVGARDEDMLNWYRGANEYIMWSFRHATDFVVVNVSDPSSFAQLGAICNDSRPMPHVNAPNTTKCRNHHVATHGF